MHFLLFLALSCPVTNLEGWSDKTQLSERDQMALTQAVKRCPELYSKSPCLKRFIKRPGQYNYWAICGGYSDNRKAGL